MRTVLVVTLLLAWTYAGAEIYKQVDENGRITYSNIPSKGAQKLNLEPFNTVPASKPKSQSPDNFPRVDSDTQKGRDGKRRQLLESELEQENKALADAKLALSEAEQHPDAFKTKSGKPPFLRNVAAYEEKIKPLQESIALHEKNIEALKEELASLK